MKKIILAALFCAALPTLAHAQIYINTGTIVSEYTYTGGFVRNVVTSGLTVADNLTFGADGNLYVADDSAGAVKKFNPDTGAFLGNVITGLNRATSCKFDADGNLYVSEYNANRVLKVNPATGSVLQTYPGVAAALGLQFMPGGDLLAAEGNSGGNVRRINITTGAISSFYASSNIADVHLLPNGNYLVADRNGSRLHRLSATGSLIGDFSATVASLPYFMDNTDTTLYIGSSGNGVYRYNINTGAFLGSFGAGNAIGVAIRPSATTVPEAGTLALLVIPFLGAIVRRYTRAGKVDLL